MASAITHFIVGAGLAVPAAPRRGTILAAGLLAVAPDLDTFLMGALGIPSDSFFGHRGFFHAPAFLIVVATAFAWMCCRREAAWIWAAAAVSHPVLDAMTDGGGGVMLLFPFSADRMFLPWRIIHVSPLSVRAFFEDPWYILASEWPFWILAGALGAVWRWNQRAATSSTPPQSQPR